MSCVLRPIGASVVWPCGCRCVAGAATLGFLSVPMLLCYCLAVKTLMTTPAVSMADAAPRAAPGRMTSCFPESWWEGAEGAWATSEILKRSGWPSGCAYIVRVIPGTLPVATAEANGSTFSSSGGGREEGSGIGSSAS